MFGVALSPPEELGSGDGDPHVVARARLEPREQAFSRPNRATTNQTTRDQQARGSGGLALREGGRIAKGPPPIRASSASPAVLAEGKPVVGVHVDIVPLQPSQETRGEVDHADHVEAVVLEPGPAV